MRNKKNPTYLLVGGANVSSIVVIAVSAIVGAVLAVGVVIALLYLQMWRWRNYE